MGLKIKVGVTDIIITLGLVVLFSAILTGCSSAPKEKEVVVTETKVITRLPPDELLKNCAIAQPPDAKTYATKDYAEKEKLLIEFAAKQTFNLGECNKDKAALRRWKKEQEQSNQKNK